MYIKTEFVKKIFQIFWTAEIKCVSDHKEVLQKMFISSEHGLESMFLLSHCGPKFTERVGPITGAGGWPITGAGGWPLGNDARHVYNFTCAYCISNSNMPRNLLNSLRRYERRLSGNQAPLQHASLQLYIGCLLSCSSVYCMDLIGQLLRFGGQRIRTFLSVLTLLLYIFTKISVSIFFY